MPSCKTCTKSLPPENDYVLCSGCNEGLHYVLKESTYRKMGSAKAAWKCHVCRNSTGAGGVCDAASVDSEEPSQPQFAAASESTSPSSINPLAASLIFGPLEQQFLSDAISRAVQKECSKMISDFQKSVDFFNDKLEDLTKLVKEKDTKIDGCISQMDSLQADNARLTDLNLALTKRVAHLEQRSRLNCVEIYGVPEPRHENVMATVASVGRAINFNLAPDMVDAVHRLRPNPNKPESPRGIILKFVSRLKKEEFLKAKTVKRNLITKDVDPSITVPSPIYINESLTPENKKLFAQCRAFKKDNNIEFLWVRGGQIKMRKQEKSRVFNINSVADLNDVH